MTSNDLDRHLAAMRRIADVVNAFESPAVQELAFQELVLVALDDSAETEPTGPNSNGPRGDRELLAQILAVFDSVADNRIHGEILAGRLGFTQNKLSGRLRPLGIRPLPEAFERGGQRKRGYERAPFDRLLAYIQQANGLTT